MTHGHNPAEEAEHTSHATHNPFDRKVALTMVIIAALLAAVKVLGHRAHNDTLRLMISADVDHTKENDKWNEFGTRKLRQHIYATQGRVLAIHLREGKLGPKTQDEIDDMARDAERNKAESEKLEKEAREYQVAAKKYFEESEAMHHRTNFFDLGEMAIEIGLVLCSLAILVRAAYFWYAGIALALVGVGVSCLGLLPAKHEGHGQQEHAAIVQSKLVSHASGPGGGAGEPG
jgi:hypothetical protein